MQQGRDIFTLSVPVAPGAVVAFRGVDFAGAQIAAANAKGMGISKRAAAVGESYEAAVIGSCVAETGGVFAVGDALAFDNQGRVVLAASLAVAAGAVAMTSAAANGAADLTGGVLPQFVCADALEASGGAGVFVEVLLRR